MKGWVYEKDGYELPTAEGENRRQRRNEQETIRQGRRFVCPLSIRMSTTW